MLGFRRTELVGCGEAATDDGLDKSPPPAPPPPAPPATGIESITLCMDIEKGSSENTGAGRLGEGKR